MRLSAVACENAEFYSYSSIFLTRSIVIAGSNYEVRDNSQQTRLLLSQWKVLI